MKELHKVLEDLSGKKVSKKKTINRLGLSVPTVRKVLKQDLSFIGRTSDEQLSYWDTIWSKSYCYEAMSLSLYFYQHRDLNRKETRKILSWVDRCSCWEHSDDLSKILAHMLERNIDWVYPTLIKWNKSSNLWKRRQSVVSLLEYSSKRKEVPTFNQLIINVEGLLGDEEYYVQKGVGWSLREVFNIYPDKTLEFIEKNLAQLSPVAYSTATEKVETKLKKALNVKRKTLRSKKIE